MKLGFIINGEDFVLDMEPEDPMDIVVELALDVSRNTGRPSSDWELRDVNGAWLDKMALTVGHFKPDSRLFLTLAIGAGGHVSLGGSCPGSAMNSSYESSSLTEM